MINLTGKSVFVKTQEELQGYKVLINGLIKSACRLGISNCQIF